jgi:hypothetical protein
MGPCPPESFLVPRNSAPGRMSARGQKPLPSTMPGGDRCSPISGRHGTGYFRLFWCKISVQNHPHDPRLRTRSTDGQSIDAQVRQLRAADLYRPHAHLPAI